MSDAFMYYTFVALWSFFISWWLTFNVLPKWMVRKSSAAHAHASTAAHAPSPKVIEAARPRHSTHDGFRGFATDGELSVEDIVQALSRKQP